MKEEYKKGLDLLNESKMKQSQIASTLGISLDMVKKLSQLNKLYEKIEDEDLLNRVKKLNFKALELNYLKYIDTLEDAMKNINEKSTRGDIKQVCEKENNKREEEIKELKTKQIAVYRDVKSLEQEIQRKFDSIKFHERKLSKVKGTYEFLEKIIQEVDETAAAYAYNKYIRVKLMYEKYLYEYNGIFILDARISKKRWEELTKKGIIGYYQNSYYSNYSKTTQINKVKSFINFMYSEKRKSEEVGPIEIEKDKQRDIAQVQREIQRLELEITHLNEKIYNLKNIDGVQEKIEKKISNKNKHIKKARKILFIPKEDIIAEIRDIVIEEVKIDTVVLDKKHRIVFYIKDRCPHEKIYDKYDTEKYLKLRNYADEVKIKIDTDSSCEFLETYIIGRDEEIAKKYKIETEKKKYIQYLLALDMSKKFLY
jgi:hypothetical protein